MPKISVIVPNYNSGIYLERLVPSLRAQTLQDIEIICVDDGSTDASAEIIRRQMVEDIRVKGIFLEQNRGQAHARNVGIEAASGEYLSFIDADDEPEGNEYFEQLYAIAVEDNADAAKGAYKDRETGKIAEKLNRLIKLDKDFFSFTYASAIFRKALIDAEHLRFPQLRDMEDPVFSLSFALKAQKISVDGGIHLLVEKRPDSITSHIPSLAQIRDKFKGLRMIVNLLNNAPAVSKDCYIFTVAYWAATVILDSLKNISPEAHDSIFDSWRSVKRELQYQQDCVKYIKTFNPELYEYLKSPSFEPRSRLDFLRLMISRAEVVSFDIFDTLLLRPFLRPARVFDYLGHAHEAPTFAKKRTECERLARETKKLLNPAPEDIQYDDIYALMPREMQKFKELELELEKQTLRANPEMLPLYEYARKLGKKIIITSDMYLPGAFLEEVLQQNGISGYHKLYVSSEAGLTKSSGNLYPHIANELGVAPEKILHIGDNPHSDYIQAEEKGWKSFYYSSPANRFLRTFDNFILTQHLYGTWLPPMLGIAFGLRVLKWLSDRQNTDFNYQLGYNYGGMLAVAFCVAIHEIAKARGLKSIIFVARDGYTLIKVYNILYPDSDLNCEYVYANRVLRRKYGSPTMTENNEYAKYIDGLYLEGEEIGIVDTCSVLHSSHRLLERYTHKKLFGIYAQANVAYDMNYINLSNMSMDAAIEKFGWSLVEYLLSSPETEIIDIHEGKPVYKEHEHPYEIKRQNDYLSIMKGILDFTHDYKKVMQDTIVCAPIPDVFQVFSRYLKKLPFSHKKAFDEMMIGANHDHSLWFSIITPGKERSEAWAKLADKGAV